MNDIVPPQPHGVQVPARFCVSRGCAIIDSVPQLLVRNLDRKLVQALKERAVRRGRSAEAEHRAILETALLGDARGLDFKAFLLSMPDAPALRVLRSKDRGRRVTL